MGETASMAWHAHSVTEGEEVEHRAEEDDDGDGYHQRTNEFVDQDDAVVLETAPDLVDKPREAIPPEDGTRHNAQIAYRHDERLAGDNERKLRETGHEEQDDEGIGDGYQKGGDAIVDERAFHVAALVHVLRGVGTVTDDAEGEQHQASQQLQVEAVGAIVDDVHDETHAHTGDERIEQVACRGPDARDESIPAPLVQRALDTQDAHRPHGSRHNHPDNQSLDYGVYNVDMECNRHIVCKIAKKM